MTSIGRACALAGAILGLAACAQQSPADTTAMGTAASPPPPAMDAPEGAVSAEEMTALFTGDTRWAWRNDRAQGIADYRADGTAAARWTTGAGGRSTVGTWRLQDDTLCTRWRDVRPGQETCFYYLPGDGGYRLIDTATGEVNSEARRIGS